jgi:hypothetical protein
VTEAATPIASPPCGDDLGGHAVGGLLGQVVDDHLRALAGQIQRMGAAQAPARPVTIATRPCSNIELSFLTPTWRTAFAH